jgi:hypothetical protein
MREAESQDYLWPESSPEQQAKRLRDLKDERDRPRQRTSRGNVRPELRPVILQRTGGKCHLCGGSIREDGY